MFISYGLNFYCLTKKRKKNFGYKRVNIHLCLLIIRTNAERLFLNLKKQEVMSTITERVTLIIADKLSIDASDVTTEANFKEDLGADSIDLVELIMEFEREFELSIPDEKAEEIQTVGNAIEFLEQAINA